jgi:hypothetical protein
LEHEITFQGESVTKIRQSTKHQWTNPYSFLKFLVASGLLVALAIPLAGQSRDPKALQIAKDVMQAMGGEDAWNDAHFVRYDFIVSSGGKTRVNRSHLWDKWAGRYRFETTRDGKSQVVLFNVNDQQGDAYVDGEKIDGGAKAEAIKGAYAAFINDMYWLAMPWKWLDPGVTLRYLGPSDHGGKVCEVVELSFNNVGLTPGDRYRAYVSPETHLMTRWEYTLQGGNKGVWSWEYKTHNGVMLASNHTNAEGASINMGDVGVYGQVDDAFFTNPAHKLSRLR